MNHCKNYCKKALMPRTAPTRGAQLVIFFQGTQAAGEVRAASRRALHGVGMLRGAQTAPEAKRYLWHNK